MRLIKSDKWMGIPTNIRSGDSLNFSFSVESGECDYLRGFGWNFILFYWLELIEMSKNLGFIVRLGG
jgi:hypothetical protein